MICALLPLLFLGTDTATGAPSERPRNIVLIVADDLGYGDLGCYGQTRIQTPSIDRLAREGRRFTDFYSGSTVCAPARCCLMTGLHSGRAWIRGNGGPPLRDDAHTMAEVFQQGGYTTCGIGKWGLGLEETEGAPWHQGFDEWFGYLSQVHAHNHYPDFLWDGPSKLRLRNVVTPVGNRLGGVATERQEYSQDLFTQRALSFLDRPHDRPFFLYLPYVVPHANNEARGKGMEVPDQGRYRHRPWPEPQRNHAAMISRLDRDVGQLISKLWQRGLARDTLVLFTSDNGPHSEGGAKSEWFDSNGPLRGMKRDLTEGGIRVPLIAWAPGTVPRGTVSDHPWAFWDLLPTFASWTGITGPRDVDGVDCTDALLGQPAAAPPRTLYWEFHERGKGRALRQGPWKLIEQPLGTRPRLYHLGWDIGEHHDLASAHPALSHQLAAIMIDQHQPSDRWVLTAKR